MFKNNNIVKVQDFYRKIDTLGVENIKAQINALQHIWGYFKKEANAKEKESYLNFFEKKDVKSMYNLMKRLSKKYEKDYLSQSYYF